MIINVNRAFNGSVGILVNNFKMVKKEDGDKKILSALKKTAGGLSITEIVENTNLTRSYVRVAIARLEGAGRVKLRKVGMAKLYSIK